MTHMWYFLIFFFVGDKHTAKVVVYCTFPPSERHIGNSSNLKLLFREIDLGLEIQIKATFEAFIIGLNVIEIFIQLAYWHIANLHKYYIFVEENYFQLII